MLIRSVATVFALAALAGCGGAHRHQVVELRADRCADLGPEISDARPILALDATALPATGYTVEIVDYAGRRDVPLFFTKAVGSTLVVQVPVFLRPGPHWVRLNNGVETVREFPIRIVTRPPRPSQEGCAPGSRCLPALGPQLASMGWNRPPNRQDSSGQVIHGSKMAALHLLPHQPFGLLVEC